MRWICLIVASLLGGCGAADKSLSSAPGSPAPSVAAVKVAAATVALGGTIARSAEIIGTNGTALSALSATWTSDNPSVATVSATGDVTGISVGEVNVRATVGGISGTARISVAGLRWTSLSTPNFTSCALAEGGSVYCWGLSSVVVGPSDPGLEPCAGEMCLATPTRLPIALAFTSLANGRDHMCGLTSVGEAWCWGRNDTGQLGATTNETCTIGGQSVPCSRTPVQVTGGHRFVALSSYRHTCGLEASGELWCWGNNARGALGAAGFQFASTSIPQRAGGTQVFKAAAVGYAHTCALAIDGAAWCWGGASGTGSQRSDGPVATIVEGNLRLTSISAGDGHSCGLTVDSLAYCWGGGSEGQLGDDKSTTSIAPVRVSGTRYVSISAGHFFSCALDASGKAWCWGLNSDGSLGIGGLGPKTCGDATCAPSPSLVARDLRFTALEAGNWTTCGRTAAGTAYCWGRNAFGGVGNGRIGASVFTPVGVAGVP